MENVKTLILDWWFITFPISFYLFYTIFTELFDLVFNSRRINNSIQQLADINKLEGDFQQTRDIQSSMDMSNLKEMERQINYQRIIGTKRYPLYWGKEGGIVNAKELADIFKIGEK